MDSRDTRSPFPDGRSPVDDEGTSQLMTSPRPLLLRRFAGMMLGVYWCVMFLATHVSFRSEGRAVPGADKVVHFVGFAILGMLLSFWIALRRPLTFSIMGVILVAIGLYGIIDELLQIPVGRDCELLDWVADILGASCGVGVMAWVSRTRR